MAGMIETSGSGLFTAAISQSPVSDWHYYGTPYKYIHTHVHVHIILPHF